MVSYAEKMYGEPDVDVTSSPDLQGSTNTGRFDIDEDDMKIHCLTNLRPNSTLSCIAPGTRLTAATSLSEVSASSFLICPVSVTAIILKFREFC